jgi:hypothetical protein
MIRDKEKRRELSSMLEREKRNVYRLSQVTENLLRLALSTALSRPLDNMGRRAKAARLLHDSVTLRAQAAALATCQMSALDFVGDHLVEQRGHLVHAASASGALQSGGGGDGFAVFCGAGVDGRGVEAAAGG